MTITFKICTAHVMSLDFTQTFHAHSGLSTHQLGVLHRNHTKVHKNEKLFSAGQIWWDKGAKSRVMVDAATRLKSKRVAIKMQ